MLKTHSFEEHYEILDIQHWVYHKLTVVRGFSSFLDVLLIGSGITSIVPVHPTSRRSKSYSNGLRSPRVP